MGNFRIKHFTVVCLVAWSLCENEAGGDLVLTETSLRFLLNYLHEKSSDYKKTTIHFTPTTYLMAITAKDLQSKRFI